MSIRREIALEREKNNSLISEKPPNLVETEKENSCRKILAYYLISHFL